jgi:transposase
MEKIDARKLSVEGRRMLRQMVIRLRQQSGMPRKDLAAVAGVHVRTVETWLSRARREGTVSLGEKKRGRPVGACRKLTLSDEMWLRDQIVDQTP